MAVQRRVARRSASWIVGIAAAVSAAAVLAACGGSSGSPSTASASSPSSALRTTVAAGRGGAPSVAASSAQPTAQPSTSEALQTPIPVPPPTAQPGVPVSVSVPRVHIFSTLEHLGLMKDGSLQQPTLFPRAGWYAQGVRPGAIGPALIYGHVDSTAGPAVFWNLQFMRLGDRINVRDTKGTTRHFVVVRIQRFPKNQFPTQAVYGPTPFPVLRLATCTGAFDESKKSYVDNLVVTAQLDAPIR